MKQYDITGMSCAACSSRVEKAVSAVSGVTSCSVNLLTNSMSVEGDASDSAVIKAVVDAGYGASAKGNAPGSEPQKNETDQGFEATKKRLIYSIIFLIPLMYLSMGHMMWDFPLPSFMDGNHVMIGLSQLLLSAVVMIINQKFFINGFKGLLHRAPNMDTLVSLGSMASFIYSTFSLFMMTDAVKNADMTRVSELSHEFYFESAATILTLITVGKMLEAKSKGRTTDALKGLMQLAPKTAVIIKNGEEETVPVEAVKKGDIFVVRPGGSIPVDGVIIEGESAVDESALTGESIPVDKSAGDVVSSATINRSGYLKCEASRVGEDTTLSQIIKMVSDASSTKAPIAKLADKVSGVFVPVVISIAILTLAVWMLIGETVGFSIARAVSVLVISCPCALGLATPVAIMVGSGMGAKNGILFKTAVSLEGTGKIQIAALDKTGTITSGKPAVTDVIPCEGNDETSLLKLAGSLEAKSEHPLASAVISCCEERGIAPEEIASFKAVSGNGLTGIRRGLTVVGGNKKFISGFCNVPDDISSKAEELSIQGKTPLYFVENGKLAGVIAVADVMRDDSKKAIGELKNMGIRVVMLTGDNEQTANAIGSQAGVDEVIAGVLPDGKESVIRRLKRQGKTAMIGDGINDAPALTAADIGIAIGAGTDIAIDAADVVLMKSRLTDVSAAVRLSRRVLRNIKENLFWAFFYNMIGIPLAAGVYIGLFGWKLNPMFGAAAMSLSSFCVVTNALRLNLVKVHDSKHDKKINPLKTSLSENGASENITIKVNGMMCGHCEGRIKKSLEDLAFVDEAIPSHEKGTVELKLCGNFDAAKVKKAIKDAGYKYLGTK